MDKQGDSKTLGVIWNYEEDCLKYVVTIIEPNRKATKIKALSTVSQLFDLLDLIGSILITEKLIIQRLWSLDIEWDEFTIHLP